MNRTLLVQSAPPAPSAFATASSLTRMNGYNANIGLLLTYPSWNAGLVYHAPFWSDISQSGGNRSSVEDDPGGTFHGHFRLPRSIAAGLAWRPAAHWTAALAVTHDQWTDALLDNLPGVAGPFNFFDNLPPALSSTQDTDKLRGLLKKIFG